MNEIIEKIKKASMIGNPKGLIDNFIYSNWCTEEDLEVGFKTLSENEESHVIIYFQLPFVTKLPAKWIKINTNYGINYIFFKNTGTKYNKIIENENYEVMQRDDFDAYENTQNAMLKDDIYGLFTKTQVMISMQVLEPRYKYFRTFLNNTRNEKAFKSLLVPSGRSWRNPMAFTNATYENDLIRKLHRELLITLYKFLQNYSIEYLDPRAYEWNKVVLSKDISSAKLNNFFAMFKTGRVSFVNIGNSMIFPYIKKLQISINPSTPSIKKLNQNTTISVYEEYLLEAVKQIEIGNPNLAVVQSFMILEWFANEIIESRLIDRLKTIINNKDIYELIVNKLSHTDKLNEDWTNKIPTKDKFVIYLKSIGITLPQLLINKFEKLRILRNTIVHKSPTLLTPSDIALNSVNDAVKIIQFCMKELKNIKNAI